MTPTFSHSYSEKGRQRFQDVPIEAAQAAVKSGNYTGLGTADLPVLQQSLQETRGYLQGELPYFEAACAQANKEYFAKLSRVLRRRAPGCAHQRPLVFARPYSDRKSVV